MDIERATSMIKALPFISKTIVDDTLYEKVLSFLTLVLSTLDVEEIKKLNQSSQIFEQIKQACLINTNQDYRVTTLCTRLIGQLVYYGKSNIFIQLEQEYPNLLLMITSGIKSSEGALRCACIEACQLFIHCLEGYQWLLNNNQATLFITFALLDQSNYVVSQACQLFSTLLKLPDKELLLVMDPSTLIFSILHPQCDEKQIKSALDFCWEIVDIRQECAIQYLRCKKLLHPIIPLLCVSDRIIRSRILEILSVLFTWDLDPLNTLGLQENNNNVDIAYIKIFDISKAMIMEATKIDDLMTAISLLDTSFILLKRSNYNKNYIKEAYSTLFALFNHEYKNVNLKSNQSKNNVFQLVLGSMNKLFIIYPEIINNNENYQQLFNILNSEIYYSDTRVLKASLELLSTTLYNLNVKKEQQNLLTKSIYSIVKIIDNSLDCKNLSIVLESFNNLLSHDEIGIFVTESVTLVEALNLKFLDTEWDIRDVVVNFVGQLFKEPWNKTRIHFALKYNLPLQVFNRIHDSEPYVRASVIQVLQNIVKCKQGWDYIQQNQSSRDLTRKLPSLLYDSEAFVRRSALDAIICLVENNNGIITMEVKDSKYSINPEILRKLINDQDSDVRIRACTLIEKVWTLYENQEQQFFQDIQAEKLLIELSNDTNRVVRIEAYRVISIILLSCQQVNKRKFNDNDEFKRKFLISLSNNINMNRLKESLDFEHLYQEAFDINADMMTQSIIPTNPDDDMNMLDCY